jgi:MFS family permease
VLFRSLYVLYNAVFVVIALVSGGLSDRMGRKPIIASSFVIFALAGVTMAIAEVLPLLALGFVLLGVYKGASEGVLKAYVADVAPKHLRGTALGAFHTAVGVVLLPGGIIAGLLWDSSLGPPATFAYGALTSVIALALLLAVGPGKEHQAD